MTSSVLLRDTLWNVPFWVAFGVAIVVGSADVGDAAEPPTGAAILQQLRSFAIMGSVLYVAAHPDDENTQAITYLARGRGYRTAYLSLTRGDGGQNLLGPQLGEALGVARTQELLAARRVDGGRQYFTRAKDFGYSKNSEETLSVWDRREILGDIVRVIREFRPDVIITRFSPKPAVTHGHHTASAVLAVEAFNLAADPAAFPEQLHTVAPWQARRIVHNVGLGAAAANPGGGMAVAGLPGNVPDGPGVVKVEVGGRDPVSGESFASIAARSRAMHKTQGFGTGGAAVNEGSRMEPFVLLAGDAAANDLLDGVTRGGTVCRAVLRSRERSTRRSRGSVRTTQPLPCRPCWRSAAGSPRSPQIASRPTSARSSIGSSRRASVSRSTPSCIAPRWSPASASRCATPRSCARTSPSAGRPCGTRAFDAPSTSRSSCARTGPPSVRLPRCSLRPRRRASRTGSGPTARPGCSTSTIRRSLAARRTRPRSRWSTSSTSADRRWWSPASQCPPRIPRSPACAGGWRSSPRSRRASRPASGSSRPAPRSR